MTGRKRHIGVNTLGLALGLTVHPASIQDRDGAMFVLVGLRRRFPWLGLIWADGGYAGDKLGQRFTRLGPWRLETVRRHQGLRGAAKALGRRENLRLARPITPSEQRLRGHPGDAAAYIHIAMIQLMLRRVVRLA